MKITAISDTHASSIDQLPEKLIEYMEESDLVIHAGDFTSPELFHELSDRYELKAVYGDSDEEEIKARLKESEVFEIDGMRVGIVHKGNYLNNFDDLGYKAKELGVNLLIFGHIHRFVIKNFGDIVILCPGSPTKPRLSFASFANIDIENSKIRVDFVALENFCGMDVRLRL